MIFPNKAVPALLALLTTAVIWGLTVPILKVNLEVIPPFTLAFVRFASAALLALTFTKVSGIKFKDFLRIGMVSFFGITLSIGLLFLGLQQTTAIDASIISLLGPVITSLLAVFAIGEIIKPSHFLGIALAFFGSFLYVLYPLIFGDISAHGNLLGNLLILLSTLSSCIYVIGSKKLFEVYSPTQISAVSFAVGTISFAPLTVFEFFQDNTWLENFTAFNLASIIFLALFSSFVAYSLYEWGLHGVEAHVDATISYLIPTISILVAAVFLKETLEPIFWISLIFIVSGIYLATKYKPPLHHHYHHRHHRA